LETILELAESNQSEVRAGLAEYVRQLEAPASILASSLPEDVVIRLVKSLEVGALHRIGKERFSIPKLQQAVGQRLLSLAEEGDAVAQEALAEIVTNSQLNPFTNTSEDQELWARIIPLLSKETFLAYSKTAHLSTLTDSTKQLSPHDEQITQRLLTLAKESDLEAQASLGQLIFEKPGATEYVCCAQTGLLAKAMTFVLPSSLHDFATKAWIDNYEPRKPTQAPHFAALRAMKKKVEQRLIELIEQKDQATIATICNDTELDFLYQLEVAERQRAIDALPAADLINFIRTKAIFRKINLYYKNNLNGLADQLFLRLLRLAQENNLEAAVLLADLLRARASLNEKDGGKLQRICNEETSSNYAHHLAEFGILQQMYKTMSLENVYEYTNTLTDAGLSYPFQGIVTLKILEAAEEQNRNAIVYLKRESREEDVKIFATALTALFHPELQEWVKKGSFYGFTEEDQTRLAKGQAKAKLILEKIIGEHPSLIEYFKQTHTPFALPIEASPVQTA